MRLHGIKAKNFLSLRDCTITDLDPHLNFIVGPNGSGKTNMFRLLKTIRDVFTAAATGRRSVLGHLCTQGIVPQEVDVSITVEFDTPWEQELISAFLCATLSQPSVLSSALAQLQGQAQSVQLSRAEHLFFAEWLAQHIRPSTPGGTIPIGAENHADCSYAARSLDHGGLGIESPGCRPFK